MTLQGWVPEIGESLTLAEVIDLAFDYRGNTTVVKADGAEIEGYVFNRDHEAPEPFIQIFDAAGNGPIRIPYSEIRNIRFTGRDMAAGNSWQGRRERRGRGEAEKVARTRTAPGGPTV